MRNNEILKEMLAKEINLVLDEVSKIQNQLDEISREGMQIWRKMQSQKLTEAEDTAYQTLYKENGEKFRSVVKIQKEIHNQYDPLSEAYKLFI